MVLDKIAEEAGVSREGVQLTLGNIEYDVMVPCQSSALTAITSSATYYKFIGTMKKAATLIEGVIRAAAIGVGATTTLDILKVASGTAPSSGTAIVTQVACNALVANTDYKLAIVTTGAQNIEAGSQIYAKIVTQATETLTPVAVSLKIKY